jgi:hypothetical protein
MGHEATSAHFRDPPGLKQTEQSGWALGAFLAVKLGEHMRITSILAAIASLGMIVVTVPSQAQLPMTKNQLIGT